MSKAKPKTTNLRDWREQTLDRMRGLILEADPAMPPGPVRPLQFQSGRQHTTGIHESEQVDARAIKALVKDAVAENGASATKR